MYTTLSIYLLKLLNGAMSFTFICVYMYRMYLKCHYLLSCIFVPNFAIDGAKLLKMLVCDSINIDTSVKRKLLLFAFIQMYSI